jgi:hypothetical protein
MKLLFVILIVTLGFCCLSVQCKSALKQVVKTEGQLIDDVARNGDEIVNGTKNNLDDVSNLLPGVNHVADNALKKNIDDFYSDILEKSVDLVLAIADMKLDELEKEQKILFEIETNNQYDTLKLAIAKKLNKQRVQTSEVRTLLLGKAIQGFKINSEKLYFIYYQFSDSFAEKELNKLQVNNNCSDEIQTYVKEIAVIRKVNINSCDKEEEEEHSIVFDILALLILGGIAFAILIYLWKGLKNLIAKKNKN